MEMLKIRKVETNKDIKKFIKLLWKIYKDYPAWVPPLIADRKKLIDKKKNPFYKNADAEFYLAEKNGEVVGRIGAIVSHNHIKEHKEKVGFFGFFECIDDQQVANLLLDKAKEFLRAHGMQAMRGPLNPSINDEVGFLIEGFEYSPAVMMTYNPPYYINLVERYGLKKARDLYAYMVSKENVISEKLERVANVVKQRNSLTFRTLNMKDFDNEVERIKKIYNGAWAYNWGAVRMTDEEFDALAKDLKLIVVPELVIIVERKGEPIGFSLALPDINMALKYNKSGRLLTGIYHLLTKKKKINWVRILVLGVLPEYKNTGAANVLFYQTAVNGINLGYSYGEASWILEDNVMMNRAAEALNGRLYKKYRIYEMEI